MIRSIKRHLLFIVLTCTLILLPSIALAHGHGKPKPVKKGILLVTFGTSVPKAQKVFKIVDRRVKKAFPGVPVRWAYTSALIRKKLAKRGKIWLSPAEALARMMAQGFTHVAVQSLHVIPGAEYHDLVSVVYGFKRIKPGFKRLLIAYPLCSTTDDLKAVVKVLMKNLPRGRKKTDAVVFMGHGTHHPAGVVYAALAYILAGYDHRVFMGTVEGYPTLDDIVKTLKKMKIKKAYLLPFMTVAGDHAMNDMAGPEKDSWKSILTKQGIKAVPVLKAITEYPAIVSIYLKHLKAAMAHFK
jgi:sirohydrochlorin cobaltochelatase